MHKRSKKKNERDTVNQMYSACLHGKFVHLIKYEWCKKMLILG